MNWLSGIFIYLIIWMVVHFMVLPLGYHLPRYIKPGWASSAPEKPKIVVKMVVTSFLSLVVWGIIHLLVTTHPEYLRFLLKS
jgi:predicted secreted protein